MTTPEQDRPDSTGDATDVRAVVQRWIDAIHRRDLDAVVTDHAADIVMFDVPPPTMLRGIDAYRDSWVQLFGWLKDAGRFDLTEFHVEAGTDVAFGYGILRCGPRDADATDLTVRLSIGLRKIDGRWIVLHEHHSEPAAS